MANSHDKGRSGRSSREFNFAGFMWRFIASLALVIASYNPTQYSFWGWVYAARGSEELGPEHFVVGVTLLIGWVILLAATQRSLGFLGLLLGGALLGGVVWLLVDIGWLNVNSMTEVTWIGLVCVSSLLAVGLSWSHVWRRLTGQFEVDDNDG
ncbi:MAG: hypothetical protein HOI35_01590 [Woeseia sp.]|jgi:hypothetical protein|nr:hypothetical protein [Woeseia sp.]MBT6208700.1 hypothetical protein [Woeseia sp.]